LLGTLASKKPRNKITRSAGLKKKIGEHRIYLKQLNARQPYKGKGMRGEKHGK